jgi:hypothetical protein
MFGTIAVAGLLKTILKPSNPKEGPPLPESWEVSWPSFVKRGIERIKQSTTR